MRMSKKAIPVCFAFYLLLQFSGCSLFSSDQAKSGSTEDTKTLESQSSNMEAGKEDEIDVAKTKLQDAEENLAKLETSLKADKEEIAREKTIYEKMVADSKKSGKDFMNPESATYKQGKKAQKLQDEYDAKLKAARAEISNAQARLQNLQQTPPNKSPVTSGSPERNNFKISDWLVSSLVGFAGSIMLGGIIFLILRNSKNVKHERAATREGFRSIGAKQSSLRQDVDQLKTTAELLSKQVSEQRSEIAALKSQLRKSENYSSNQPAARPLEGFTPPLATPASEFPVSVENYLAKKANGASFGKHDPLFGTLKETDDGAFYLVRDGILNDDARYAVPRAKQFVTKDDFVYHYSNYYVCANPTGGEVWIRKPATVRRTTDGWKLDATGELEIR